MRYVSKEAYRILAFSDTNAMLVRKNDCTVHKSCIFAHFSRSIFAIIHAEFMIDKRIGGLISK